MLQRSNSASNLAPEAAPFTLKRGGSKTGPGSAPSTPKGTRGRATRVVQTSTGKIGWKKYAWITLEDKDENGNDVKERSDSTWKNAE